MADIFDKEKRSEIMRKIKNKDTTPEIKIRKLLSSMGYKYRLSTKKLKCNPDIVFPTKKKVIFINGCFWHGHECRRGHLPETNKEFWRRKIQKNIDRDQINYNECVNNGWSYLIIWQCEIKSTNITLLNERLDKFLK